MNNVRRATAHSFLALLEALLIASMLVALVAGTAFAGKGGGGGGKHQVSGGTMALKMVTDANGNGAPNWGDQVTYDLSSVTVTDPYVTTTCTQNGTTVLSTWAGYYPGYMWPAAQTITLSSELWTGGAATCKGVLYGTSTTLTFTVGG